MQRRLGPAAGGDVPYISDYTTWRNTRRAGPAWGRPGMPAAGPSCGLGRGSEVSRQREARGGSALKPSGLWPLFAVDPLCSDDCGVSLSISRGAACYRGLQLFCSLDVTQNQELMTLPSGGSLPSCGGFSGLGRDTSTTPACRFPPPAVFSSLSSQGALWLGWGQGEHWLWVRRSRSTS